MPRKRGKRWTASGYHRGPKRKIHLGTFDTRREAAEREAEHALSTRPTGRETIDSFAGRWVRDYPRARLSSNTSNADRIKPLMRELGGLRLTDVSRPMGASVGAEAPLGGSCRARHVRGRDERRALGRQPVREPAPAR